MLVERLVSGASERVGRPARVSDEAELFEHFDRQVEELRVLARRRPTDNGGT
jgi:hypothetical protein